MVRKKQDVYNIPCVVSLLIYGLLTRDWLGVGGRVGGGGVGKGGVCQGPEVRVECWVRTSVPTHPE